jgi:hypothetical protein
MNDIDLTTDPAAAELVAAVEADVRAGLDGFVHPLEFTVVGPFADRGALVDGPFAAVQWQLVGVDDGRGFNGMWPTGKSVCVAGLTVIDRRGEPWLFHRHVDWNLVNAQLGGSRGRTSSPLLVKKPEEAQYLAALHYGFDTATAD